MNRSLHSSNTDYQQSISGLLSLLRAEFLGVLCIVGGALLFASVFGFDPNGRDAPPLLYVLMGWTAPLFGIMVLVLGVVLLLGRRAGYWSAEALVGAELLLLGLATGSWVAANRAVTWNPRLGAEAGGLVGWALGSLATATLGRPLAGLLVTALVITAVLMLGIMALGDNNNGAPKGFAAALLIGILIAVIGASLGPLTGFAMNPARDFGPKLFAFFAGWGDVALTGGRDNPYFWVPILGPIVGAQLGTALYVKVLAPCVPGNRVVTEEAAKLSNKEEAAA